MCPERARTIIARSAFALACALVLGDARDARAQACCAGSGAITPGRLANHENALAGAQLKAAMLTGSYDDDRRYRSVPSGTSELDFEEAVFGSARMFRRAQGSLYVPFVETRRVTRTASGFGGGVGDVNLGGRYDFTLAGASDVVPGIAMLVGLTLPTGTPADAAREPLATDATGIGAFQGTLGLALEQTYGPWLLNLSALAAKRTPRDVGGLHTALGTQWTGLAAVAYAFDADAALALVASTTFEGAATIAGTDVPQSARAVSVLSASGTLAVGDHWRVQGSLFVDPPIGGLGRNQPASAGTTFALLYSSW